MALLSRLLPSWAHPTELWVSSLRKRFREAGVLGGPFQGLRIGDHDALGNPVIVPGLLGIYEKELHPVVEDIVHRHTPASIVNLGAGEGYYAVGFARRIPTVRVVGYELDTRWRATFERHVRENGVSDRVESAAAVDAAGLQARLAQLPSPTLVVCDIEGAEREILDPSRCPALAHCYLLVELHGADVERELRERFASTHTQQIISSRERTMADVPQVPWYLRFSDPAYLLVERPSHNNWLWARPR